MTTGQPAITTTTPLHPCFEGVHVAQSQPAPTMAITPTMVPSWSPRIALIACRPATSATTTSRMTAGSSECELSHGSIRRIIPARRRGRGFDWANPAADGRSTDRTPGSQASSSGNPIARTASATGEYVPVAISAGAGPIRAKATERAIASPMMPNSHDAYRASVLIIGSDPSAPTPASGSMTRRLCR